MQLTIGKQGKSHTSSYHITFKFADYVMVIINVYISFIIINCIIILYNELDSKKKVKVEFISRNFLPQVYDPTSSFLNKTP